MAGTELINSNAGHAFAYTVCQGVDCGAVAAIAIRPNVNVAAPAPRPTASTRIHTRSMRMTRASAKPSQAPPAAHKPNGTPKSAPRSRISAKLGRSAGVSGPLLTIDGAKIVAAPSRAETGIEHSTRIQPSRRRKRISLKRRSISRVCHCGDFDDSAHSGDAMSTWARSMPPYSICDGATMSSDKRASSFAKVRSPERSRLSSR